jgi:hypothetical protein
MRLSRPGRLTSALIATFLFVLAGACLRLTAQVKDKESALSEAEVEKLRDTAYYPPDRVMTFIDFLDQRTKQIDKLTTGKRQPGREEDIHDLMEQFTSIADDLDDNLDDYGKYHRDIRKVLPKVVAATERWGTALRSPPEHEAYNIQRKLALETLADIHETATKMIDEQKAWFLAHPPPKDNGSKAPPPPRE